MAKYRITKSGKFDRRFGKKSHGITEEGTPETRTKFGLIMIIFCFGVISFTLFFTEGFFRYILLFIFLSMGAFSSFIYIGNKYWNVPGGISGYSFDGRVSKFFIDLSLLIAVLSIFTYLSFYTQKNFFTWYDDYKIYNQARAMVDARKKQLNNSYTKKDKKNYLNACSKGLANQGFSPASVIKYCDCTFTIVNKNYSPEKLEILSEDQKEGLKQAMADGCNRFLQSS
tara:strand:+ start:1405 stop:2085 length:681 start_codon:yes stop_codon:yes gene_type:complete